MVLTRPDGVGPLSPENDAPLRFTRLRLENWRNFRQVEVDLQARTFIVGPNASGKTNLLDSLRFLGDIVSGGGFQTAVDSRSGVSAIRSFYAPKHSDIEVEVTLGTDEEPELWAYKIRFNQDSQRQPRVKKEVVERQGDTLLDRPDEDDEEDPELLTQTHLEQVNVNRRFRAVAQFMEEIRYSHLVPALVRDPDRYSSDKEDPHGGDFLNQIASTNQRVRDARLRRIQEALRIALPNLAELVFEKDETSGAAHLRARFGDEDENGTWQREDHLSDGTLRLLGLLWAAQDKRGPLLLEEPGLSLHAEIVRSIPQMLARIQQVRDRQILLTTHSTELLRDEGIGLDEVLLLIPTNEETRVQTASSVKEAEALLEHGSSLADIAIAKTRPGDSFQLPLMDWGE